MPHSHGGRRKFFAAVGPHEMVIANPAELARFSDKMLADSVES
ncbi:hypothetical protein ACVIIV_004373 [Bradyrhizobium sp. USDA 4354]